jgi:hypothetical protein
MKYQSINLAEKFGLLTEQWAPRVVAEMNNFEAADQSAFICG